VVLRMCIGFHWSALRFWAYGWNSVLRADLPRRLM
jgi:hypothetical protein